MRGRSRDETQPQLFVCFGSPLQVASLAANNMSQVHSASLSSLQGSYQQHATPHEDQYVGPEEV